MTARDIDNQFQVSTISLVSFTALGQPKLRIDVDVGCAIDGGGGH